MSLVPLSSHGTLKRRVVIGLDVLTVGLALLTATIINVGGFIVRFSDIRISLRTPQRALIWLVAVLIARLILDRHTGPFDLSRAHWRRLRSSGTAVLCAQRRRVRRSVVSEPFLVHASAGQWRRAALASLGIALALAILMHDQLRHPYSVLDLGDPLFMMWDIGWVAHQLVTDPAHLFDGNMFYPERLTLTRSDPMLLPALMAAPLLAAECIPSSPTTSCFFPRSGFRASQPICSSSG